MGNVSKDISVVFFGSGPVAAKSLELLARNFTVEAVITKPRPAHFKGDFPVIDWCSRPDAPIGKVLTVTNKKELSELFRTQQFFSRLGVVIDFGIMIAQDVIDAFPLGIINSHFSLLPELRGADPITFSILSGQKRTGISLMLITAGLDEGPLLAQTPFDILPTTTTPELTEALIKLSDSALQEILPSYVAGQVQPQPQELVTIAAVKQPTFSRKLTKDDGVLDFNKPAVQLEREIRAFIEWPKSRTVLMEKEVVITKAHTEPGSDTPGKLLRSDKKIGFYTAEDILMIDALKPVGKPEMSAESFLAGYGKA